MTTAEEVEKFIKKTALETKTEMNEVVRNRIFQAFEKSKQTKTTLTEPNIWRIIMKSRITKIAAAAVIIFAVLTGIHQFGGSIDIASVTFADVLENICSSKTLTFMVRTKEHEPPIMKVMVIDPYLSRFEFIGEQIRNASKIGGNVWVVDTGKGKALILDTVKKTGRVSPAKGELLEIYNTFRNFRDRIDFSVEKIVNRQIGDKEAIGFKLRKEDESHEIIVWADTKTKLPILIEESYKSAKGQIIQHVVTDIVFDAVLDMSLFSLRPPEGYKVEEFKYYPQVNRLKSAANMDRIIKACRKYVNEHDGQWPDNLHELDLSGIDVNNYIYLKPSDQSKGRVIVLYDVHDAWGSGINVGFKNYRVEFMEDESEFRKLLGDN